MWIEKQNDRMHEAKNKVVTPQGESISEEICPLYGLKLSDMIFEESPDQANNRNINKCNITADDIFCTDITEVPNEDSDKK